jgi:hypothetical protein
MLEQADPMVSGEDGSEADRAMLVLQYLVALVAVVAAGLLALIH